MTEQEIIAAAKTNWLAWQGLRELQPEVAAWMEEHKADCVWHDHVCNIRGPVARFLDGYVYRLRPDYEPVLKWFFHPATLQVIPRNMMTENEPGKDWLEITADYAAYLRNKPDGEWELRMAKAGECYWCMYDKEPETFGSDLADIGPKDRGYRWCKPKQPEAGWREYAVVERKGSYMIDGYGNATSGLNLYKALGRGGFGGVQFEGQRHSAWMMQINYLIDDAGMLMHCEKAGTCKPAIPVKVRFWEAQQ